MLFKIATLFIIAMGFLAMIGRLRFPGKPKAKRDNKLDNPIICNKCGGFVIGSGDCACTKPPAKKG